MPRPKVCLRDSSASLVSIGTAGASAVSTKLGHALYVTDLHRAEFAPAVLSGLEFILVEFRLVHESQLFFARTDL